MTNRDLYLILRGSAGHQLRCVTREDGSVALIRNEDNVVVMSADAPKRDGDIAERLEYLRGEIRAERISYGEIAELQGLAEHIEPGDVELLEWAGVPEHDDKEGV